MVENDTKIYKTLKNKSCLSIERMIIVRNFFHLEKIGFSGRVSEFFLLEENCFFFFEESASKYFTPWFEKFVKKTKSVVTLSYENFFYSLLKQPSS